MQDVAFQLQITAQSRRMRLSCIYHVDPINAILRSIMHVYHLSFHKSLFEHPQTPTLTGLINQTSFSLASPPPTGMPEETQARLVVQAV